MPTTRPIAWLAIVADYGTLALLIALPRLAAEARSTSRRNLLHSFVSSEPQRTIHIKLYRRGIALISIRFHPPAPCDPHGSKIESAGLSGIWSATSDGYALEGYASPRRLTLVKNGDRYTSYEANYPQNDYPYDDLDRLQFEKQP